MKNLSMSIAEKLVSSGDETPIEVVAFGIDAIISKVLHFGSSLILAAFFGKIIEMVFFFVFYSIMRSYAGGFHAKSKLSCLISSWVMAIMVLCFWSFVPSPYLQYSCLFFLLFSVPVIVKLAPMEAKNKPLDSAELDDYRNTTVIVLLLEGVLVVLGLWAPFFPQSMAADPYLQGSSVMMFFVPGVPEFLQLCVRGGSTALFFVAVFLLAGKSRKEKASY